MTGKIKQLEAIAQALEPDLDKRQHLRKKVVEYTESFLKNINNLKAYNFCETKGIELYNFPISEKPINIETALNLIENYVDKPGLNPASSGYLGYIPGGGIYLSALGDYMAAISNLYASVFYTAPGAVRMENLLLNWMSKLVKYPASAGGNLTSGGSIANLTAIVTARTTSQVKAKDFDKLVVYLTRQAHHSLIKALQIAGLDECVKRYILFDTNYRMDTNDLEKVIKKDKQKGLLPWMVIASAGTTDTGAVDPLDKIGDLAKKHQLWYHIDGAYGAFFILCDEGKKILHGIEKSDSIVMDPHKGLFLPYGIGTILVKDKQKLYKTYHHSANYLQDTTKDMDELSPADLSPEMTKHFRALRLWLPLKLLGINPFKAALEEKILLARYFYKEIQKLSGFETGPYPDLSIVIFRYVPPNGNINNYNERLTAEIVKDGRVFLSSTMIGKTYYLRLVVLSFRTHLKTINLAISILKEKVCLLNNNL